MNPQAIIYDLDGTIISTAQLHEHAWQKTADQFGITLTPQMLIDQKGLPEEVTAKELFHVPELKRQEFVLRKRAITLEDAHTVTLNPTFTETARGLRKRGVRLAVCTSAPRAFVDKAYSTLQELQKLTTLAREDYEKGKPNPDPLLATCKRIDVEPKNCIYVGDAVTDFKAAKAAGMPFIYFCQGRHDPRIPTDIPKISLHEELLQLLKEA